MASSVAKCPLIFQCFQSLLQTVSSIISPDTEQHTQPPSQLQAKRILYVKSIVRLLRLCGSKYQQLLTTPDGLKSFHTAIFNLLALINGVVTKGTVLSVYHIFEYVPFISINLSCCNMCGQNA